MGLAGNEEVFQDLREFYSESRVQRGSFGETAADLSEGMLTVL